MTFSLFRPLLLAALALAAIGCDQGRTARPETSVAIINAVPGYSAVTVARGADPNLNDAIRGLAYRNGALVSYDEDTYNFGVYSRDLINNLALVERKRFTKSIVAGTSYVIVVAQLAGGVQELILESTPPAASAAESQVLAVHAAETFPPLDIYLERPGADLLAAVPWGTLGFTQSLAARNVATGEYQVTLTEAGNRANVVLQTSTFVLEAARSTTFVIAPEDDAGIDPLSVVAAQAGAFNVLIDSRGPSAVRVINAAADGAPRDVAFAGQFTPPLFPSVAFGTPTAYADVEAVTNTAVNVTPPGNPGVLELDQTISPIVSRRQTLMFLGDAGALTHTFVPDDTRHILGESQVRFYNAAKQFSALDILVIPAGIDPNTLAGDASLAPGTIGAAFSKAPGDYQLYLRQTLTATIVAGPIPVSLAEEGVYGVLVTNGPTNVTANVALIDEFQ